MARAVVLLGGGADVGRTIERLLDDGAAVVLVDHVDVLARVVSDVPDRHDRARLAVIAGDPGSAESQAAALELAAEHYGSDAPEVVVFSPGLDPTVK